MNEEGAQPTADRMTSPPSSCYYAGCEVRPKWGIASSVAQKNPDGTDLTLYTCDKHYEDLTGELRSVGTKYTLFPVNGPHLVQPEDGPPLQMINNPGDPGEIPGVFREPTFLLGKVAFNGACVAAGLIIAPFLLVYYGGKWIFGWRPSNLEDL